MWNSFVREMSKSSNCFHSQHILQTEILRTWSLHHLANYRLGNIFNIIHYMSTLTRQQASVTWLPWIGDDPHTSDSVFFTDGFLNRDSWSVDEYQPVYRPLVSRWSAAKSYLPYQCIWSLERLFYDCSWRVVLDHKEDVSWFEVILWLVPLVSFIQTW